MNTRLVVNGEQSFLECIPDGTRIESEQEALDLVAACAENETDRLLIHAESLTDDFYNLRTGLAGGILLKFSNYRIKVAAVIPPDKISGRFAEMVLETNRGNQFRVFQSLEKAEEWLVGTSR